MFEINQRETRARARTVLNRYRRYSLTSGHTIDLQSPRLSDMPRAERNIQGLENRIIKQLDAEKKCVEILEAINQLEEKEAAILKLSYCAKERYTMNMLTMKIKGYKFDEFGNREEYIYSIKNLERIKANALINFAYAYKAENLIVGSEPLEA